MSRIRNRLTSVNEPNASGKSTYMPSGAKKAPTSHAKKAPTCHHEKAPAYYCTIGVLGVVLVVELVSLLRSQGQQEWTTPVRCSGLMALLNWICTHGSKPCRASAALGAQYVSPIKRRKRTGTIPAPLNVLCGIGIIEETQAAVCCHVKVSREYKLTADYADKIRKIPVALPPLIRRKLETADARMELRLNQRHPFREQLLADLCKLGLAPKARPIIAEMHRRKRGGSGMQNIVAAIDAKKHAVKVDKLGTAFTTISSLPRELKPLLTIDGKRAVSCDISHTHHCFLPRLLSDRMEHAAKEKPDRDPGAMRAEHQRLVDALSGPDYYRQWCKDKTDDAERQVKKGLINALLNMPNSRCTGNGFYQRMKREFPLTFGIVEAIKQDDHRNLSKQLQRFTSTAINGALCVLQAEGIAAIPQTDAILCKTSDQDRVRQVIGQWMLKESTGVWCKVNGVSTAPAPPKPRRKTKQ